MISIFLLDEKVKGNAKEIYEWLNTNIGLPVSNMKVLLEIDNIDDYEHDSITWLYAFVEGGYKFYFKKKSDAMLFKLSWG